MLAAVHLILVLVGLSIPFWPRDWLKIGIWIPFALALIWLLFDGCPLSQAQQDLQGQAFTHELLQRVWPNLTEARFDQLATVVLVAITLAAGLRLAN